MLLAMVNVKFSVAIFNKILIIGKIVLHFYGTAHNIVKQMTTIIIILIKLLVLLRKLDEFKKSLLFRYLGICVNSSTYTEC